MIKTVDIRALFFALNLSLIVLPAVGCDEIKSAVVDEEGGAGRPTDSPFQSVFVGGLNGHGGKRHSALAIINTSPDNTQFCETPTWREIDLGQEKCIKHFENQLPPDYLNRRTIFYGASNGAATLLNWLGRKTFPEQKLLASALVLESVFSHANSAIWQAANNFLPLGSLITHLPLARIWLPLLTKTFVYQSYRPCGLQPIYSAAKISPDIPVILMHNEGDDVLNIRDARAVYCSFLRAGHKKTYFIKVNNGNSHLNILDYPDHRIAERNRIIAGLQSIYSHHNLPFSPDFFRGDQDIKEYQPSLASMEKLIRWSPHRLSRNIVDSGSIVTAAYFAGRALI